MALRNLLIAPCNSIFKGSIYCIEDTTPPSLIVGNTYAMSAFTSGLFTRFNTGCYTILGESDIECVGPDPEVVVFSSAFGPEQCEDCQTSIANAIQLSPCNISLEGIIISIDAITPTPSIGDIFNITVVYIDRNTGEQVLLTGCYSVSRFGFLPPNRIDALSPVVSYSAQTDCETCLNNNGILYEVYECLTDSLYIISFPNNTFSDHLVTFTGLDGVTQYCGFVKGISKEIIATGLLVSDLGVYNDENNNCNSCLETVADKKKLVNCLTGGEVIVWASTLFTVGDATNLSFDNGCYEISSDPVDPSTPVDINELANFDPHSNCEDCLECHGATYYYSSCTEVEICGNLSSILMNNYIGGRDIWIDSNNIAFVSLYNNAAIVRIDLNTQTYLGISSTNLVSPTGIDGDETNGVICIGDANSNRLNFIDYNNTSNVFLTSASNSFIRKIYFDSNSGLFFITFLNCCSNKGIEVWSASSYNTPTLVTSFGNNFDSYYDVKVIGSKIYAANYENYGIDVFDSTTYSYEGTLSTGGNIPFSISSNGSSSLYVALNSASYAIIDLSTSATTTSSYSVTCNTGADKSIKVNSVSNKFYITDPNCGNVLEFDLSTGNLLKVYTFDMLSQFFPYGIQIDTLGNTWFSSTYNLFQVGCNLEYITGSINSNEYIPIGNTFYHPIKEVCSEVTSIDTSFNGEYNFYSVLSYSGCPECTGQTFDLFYCEECSDGLYSGLLVAPSGLYNVGEFVKSHWGNSNWFCFEILDSWTPENYGTPEVIFDAEGDISYSSCTDCQGAATLGITVINCDTLVESQVTVTFEQWAQIEGAFGFSYPVISDTNGNCYVVVNSCPIDNIYPPFPLGDFYFNSTQCRANQIGPIPPRSANTETVICEVCCPCESGSTFTVIPPHPVWTDGRGTAVTQLNMITLGGENGLNN